MFIQGALVGFSLVASALGNSHSDHTARAAALIGIPDSAYPATPPFQPVNIVPPAVNRVCRPDSNNPTEGPRPGKPTFIHKPGLKNGPGIVITLGDCVPPTDSVAKRSPEEEARDTAFHEQFAGLFGSNNNGSSIRPFRPALKVAEASQPAHVDHEKRQSQCKYPDHRPCRFLPGGENLVGYDRCGYECAPLCVDPGQGPKPTDCDHIFENLDQRIDKDGNLVAFSIPQDKFVMFTFGTCATVIHNHIPAVRQSAGPGCRADLVYSYTAWAQAGRSMITKCQENTQNGICRDASAVGVDFYMQMYSFESI